MSRSTVLPVLPTNEARVELPRVLRRFREEGVFAEVVVFGAQRRPEGVMIPFELYTELLPVIEDLKAAHLAAAASGSAEGVPVPIAEIAEGAGLNPEEYQ